MRHKFKHFYGFAVNFHNMQINEITRFVSILLEMDKYEADRDFVSWNYFGNYVLWADDFYSIYICKNYFLFKGIPIFNDKAVINAVKYLKQFKINE